MVDDQDLAGLDPYDLMATEAVAARRVLHAPRVRPTGRSRARCEGWSVRDLLAHLAASEDYNRGVSRRHGAGSSSAEVGAKGAIDLASANEIGIHELRRPGARTRSSRPWRARSAQNREGFRARDGGDVDSSVGPYPARWQAFHLAFELATHADDVGVPVAAGEAADRIAWQARFGRFAIKELKPDLDDRGVDGRTHVQGRRRRHRPARRGVRASGRRPAARRTPVSTTRPPRPCRPRRDAA